jgi:hypothetical protein
MVTRAKKTPPAAKPGSVAAAPAAHSADSEDAFLAGYDPRRVAQQGLVPPSHARVRPARSDRRARERRLVPPRRALSIHTSLRDVAADTFQTDKGVGQDGLVANVAKYLTGQVVVGLNPSRALFDGVLVRKSLDDLGRLFGDLEAGDPPVEERAMVSARIANGSAIVALNEVFIGHVGHQSARYVLRRRAATARDQETAAERQSSSGLIVSTGTGATGWASSVARERKGEVPLPGVGSTDLVFFVREAFASVRTGTSLTQGVLRAGESIEVRWEMEDGVVFGDGIEKDRLALSFGEVVTVARAETRLRLAL